MVNKRLVRTIYNQDLFQDTDINEINGLPSQTVPDQSMSVREILSRHADGYPISVSVPYFNGEDGEFIDPRTLDLAERQQLAEELGLELQQLRDGFGKKDQNNDVVIEKTTLPPVPDDVIQDIKTDTPPAQPK
jgi:hypothetical protein